MSTPRLVIDTDTRPAEPVTLARWVALVEQLRRMRRLQSEYARTCDPFARRRKERAEDEMDAAIGWLVADLAALDAAADAAAAEAIAGLVPAQEGGCLVNTPVCPKCGRPMTGGAPHGPWPVQWECRPCDVFVPKGGAA